LAAVAEWDGVSGGKPTIRMLHVKEDFAKSLILKDQRPRVTGFRGLGRVNKTISVSLHPSPLLDSDFGS
jgi:hypothetical protein